MTERDGKHTIKHDLPCYRTASLWVLWVEAGAALIQYRRDAAVYLELNAATYINNKLHQSSKSSYPPNTESVLGVTTLQHFHILFS